MVRRIKIDEIKMSFRMNLNYKKVTSRGVLSVLLSVLIAAGGWAQTELDEAVFEDLELTLTEAIEVALANNPELNRALLSVEDADQLVTIAYSEVYPNISSSISYTRNIEIPVQYIPARFFDPNAPEGALAPVEFGTDNNWQGGFTVTQKLFQDETIVGLSTSTIFKYVQKEAYRATSQQVITQTRVAYYQVLVAKEQLRLQQAQINRLEQNLRENRARAEAGIVDSYSVLQLEVQLSNQRPQLIEAEYGVDEAYRNLKMVLGLPLALDFEVIGNLNEFDILSETSSNDINSDIKKVDRMNTFMFHKEGLTELGLEEFRGDIRTLDASLNLKDKEITAIKSRFLPTLNAVYNLQWNSAEPGSPTFFENQNRFQTLGVNFSLPLFQGFKRVADVERAQIQKKDLRLQKKAALLNAQNEVASASETINKVFETAQSRKKALEQAQIGYDRAQKRLENGLGSQIEVTEAEVQVRQAEVNYAAMVFEYLTAKAQYDLATGMVPFVDTTNE
jgi:outer membrane protein TolC